MTDRHETMASASILVVDPDPDERQSIRGLLGKEDCITVGVNSGQAALDLLKTNPLFDLILLHVAPGDMESAEVCQQLKADSKSADIPIILMSTPLEERSRVREALDAGALGYVCKPIDGNAVWAWMRAAHEIRSAGRPSPEGEEGVVPCDYAVLEQFAKLSHTVNNPFQGIYATADMLGLEFPEGAKGRERIEKIIEYAQMVSDIVAEAARAAKRQLGL